jgi:hypothetical protein
MKTLYGISEKTNKVPNGHSTVRGQNTIQVRVPQAFLKPVKPNQEKGEDTLTRAITELTKRRNNFNAVYGDCADTCAQFNVE